MAKLHKMVDPLQPRTSTNCLETDWSKCIICLNHVSEVLRCPAGFNRVTQGSRYKTLSELLLGFQRTGCFPRSINLSRLDDGNDIAETLQQHKAKWHDSCRLLYNRTKLQRSEKRKSSPEDGADEFAERSKKFTRKSTGKKSAGEKTTSAEKNASCVPNLPQVGTPWLEKHQHSCWNNMFVLLLVGIQKETC